MIIIKKSVPARAFQLGNACSLEREFISRGLLLPLPEGLWRVKTRESPTEGELAKSGDYIKIDRSGMPYPTGKEWFEANHVPLKGGMYLQTATPRKAWQASEPVCPEIRFLLDQGLLRWNPEDQSCTFQAYLWGTEQTAAGDAVVVLDRVETDSLRKIQTVEFHFVAKEEFQSAYDVLNNH